MRHPARLVRSKSLPLQVIGLEVKMRPDLLGKVFRTALAP
jgi:hypothetical protein